MELKSFTHLVDTLRPQLLNVAQHSTHRSNEAEDFVQETLLRLWNMREKLDNHPNPQALAHVVLRNIMHDAWRTTQRQGGPHATLNDRSMQTTSAAARTDEIELIQLIVEQLPPVQAQIFKLKEIEGYENEEIMQIVGCSADNLRQILSRTRRKICAEFQRLSKQQL